MPGQPNSPPPTCNATKDDKAAEKKHEGMAHVCIEDAFHAGRHLCTLCGDRWS